MQLDYTSTIQGTGSIVISIQSVKRGVVRTLQSAVRSLSDPSRGTVAVVFSGAAAQTLPVGAVGYSIVAFIAPVTGSLRTVTELWDSRVSDLEIAISGPRQLVPTEVVGALPSWLNCSDDPTYSDKNDNSCLDWSHSTCSFASTVMGYTDFQVADLIARCPESCKTCVLEPSTSTTYTVPPETTVTTRTTQTVTSTTTVDPSLFASNSQGSGSSKSEETQMLTMAIAVFILVSLPQIAQLEIKFTLLTFLLGFYCRLRFLLRWLASCTMRTRTTKCSP